MGMVEVRCTTCGKRENFSSRFDAGSAGWGSYDIVHAGKNKYGVFCPAHVPDFIKEVSSGAKRSAK